MGDMTGLLGNSGAYSQRDLLGLCEKLAFDGTLVTRFASGTRLILIESGRQRDSFELGEPGDEARTGIDFHLQPHHSGDVPQLASMYPESALPAMRALPALGPAQGLFPGLFDLRALVAWARREGLNAALTVHSNEEQGIALFFEGRIAAALFERDGFVWERSDALRAIYRFSLEPGRPSMQLQRLEPEVAGSLLGLASGRRAGSAEVTSFTGLSAGEGGCTFYCSGRPFLYLAAEFPAGGRFTPLETVPDLDLPDDPPGWERRRFDLTLRGRDALNPMTELSMRFGDNYGERGRQVLEAVKRGHSIEEAARGLGMDLQALKPWLERLESDGLIRLRR